MKSYPYNREGAEGRRLFKLLDVQFNPGVLESQHAAKSFETYNVLSVMQCRVNRASFLFPSNLSGIQRPQIRVESDVEMAWGEFTKDITAMDFTSGEEELPLVYTQPLDDDTMKYLIDAGLYSDPKFERLISKLMTDELFDAEADMRISYMDATQDTLRVPILMADPVDVVHTNVDPSERTTLADLVKRSAAIAIELRKEGINTEQVMQIGEQTADSEVFIHEPFDDAISSIEEDSLVKDAEAESDGFRTSSILLDKEIDVTDQLAGTLGVGSLTEDDRIRDLKLREQAAQDEDDTAFDAEVNESFDFDVTKIVPESVETVHRPLVEDDDDDLSFLTDDEDDLER